MMISTSLIIDSCKNRNNERISVKCRLGNIDPSWRFCSTNGRFLLQNRPFVLHKPRSNALSSAHGNEKGPRGNPIGNADESCEGPLILVRRSACGPPKRSAQPADQPVFWRPAATPETVQRIR